jgi:hypothetical protein
VRAAVCYLLRLVVQVSLDAQILEPILDRVCAWLKGSARQLFIAGDIALTDLHNQVLGRCRGLAIAAIPSRSVPEA